MALFAPARLGPTVLITAFTLTGFSTTVIATRLICRQVVAGRPKCYDYLMIMALLFTWGISVTNYFQVKFGTGRHSNDQPEGDPQALLEGTLKSWYTYQIAYLVDLFAIKFSILVFYRTIAAQKRFRSAVDIMLVLVGLYTIGMVLVNSFECPNPVDAWSVKILFQDGSCINLHPLYYVQAALNILSDFVILVLPMPTILGVQMSVGKRIALVAIFSVGALAIVASGFRAYALHIWTVGTDTPYDGAYILIWSQVEINTAIVTASIPSLQPLFKKSFEDNLRTKLKYGFSESGVHETVKGPKDITPISMKAIPSTSTKEKLQIRCVGNASDYERLAPNGEGRLATTNKAINDSREWSAKKKTLTPRPPNVPPPRPLRPDQILQTMTVTSTSSVNTQPDHAPPRGPLSPMAFTSKFAYGQPF